jgi:rhodanese-related sulfurtransferase
MTVSVITDSIMVETLSPAEAATLVGSQIVDVIDVRDEHEWVAGHLPGARSVTLDQLRADPDAALTPGATLLFVCAKGARSLTAAKIAERLGFTKVFNLDGGTREWARAGLPLVVEERAAAA